ncbi:protein-glutamine gamma-glutamyltransferase 2-like isoform X1 [Chiloscyllium plagiosum]|uniref:protein-glutamine gamma-glutamyltransferase 2-like isoform X1 n=2 Tax=Chiloscyllium plagiosum TaxID=36176 RepID=UPI001CB7C2FD|nr:protein-glutamine gamma-glutamyltransferase 2-like isoform X1 [Chiloscyllium plagiosum]
MLHFLEMNFTVDLQSEKNNHEHRTTEISTEQLIIRRGQPFHLTLQSYSDEFIDNGTVVICAETGPKPSTAFGTKILLELNSYGVNFWKAVVVSSTGTRMTLQIHPSPNAKIGQYKLSLQRMMGNKFENYLIGEFILLFNPWCKEDAVFLDDEQQRQEYVMNEEGIIYTGSSHCIQSRAWYFGQFADNVLDVCLKLMDNNNKCLSCPEKDYVRRNDPTYISRMVTAMVNCCDDKGILEGRWSAPYCGGTCPWNWNGSVAILTEWNDRGCRKVQYGQCWVFAAVACTVLRCLGIPTRVVTNFNSAHDSNGNLTIDKVCDEYGRDLGGPGDSIWNFHVWIESWMARNDLVAGYDGWQVLDPTPQEKSEGIYCCGPAPVKAVKEGFVDLKFDVPFVFAEVNADQVTWIQCRDGRKEKMHVETQHVGQNISTKKCGRPDREDITDNYKYREGSFEERAIVSEADLRNRHTPLHPRKLLVNVKAEESITNGSDINVCITISNNSSTTMYCNLNFNAQIMNYNGRSLHQIAGKHFDKIAVQGNRDEKVVLQIPCSDYADYIENHHLIRLTALANDSVTHTNALGTKDLSVINPDIDIQLLGTPVLNRPMKAEIILTNPLRIPLHQCVFTVEGLGLIHGMYQTKVHEIGPQQTLKLQLEFTPTKTGPRKLMVDFDSAKLKDMKGFKNLTVQRF